MPFPQIGNVEIVADEQVVAIVRMDVEFYVKFALEIFREKIVEKIFIVLQVMIILVQ